MRLSLRNSIVFSLPLIFAVGCASRRSDTAADRRHIQQSLAGEVSLKADRSHLDSLRQEIPKDRQQANDELALFLQMLSSTKDKPETLRTRFAMLLQKRRTAFRGKVQKLRDEFRDGEANRREEFTQKQREEREALTERKPKSDELRRFFTDAEKSRQTFSSEQRLRRQSFEEELNAQLKDFESHMRDRNSEFTEQMRIYTKAYQEQQAERKSKKTVEFEGQPIDLKPLDQSPSQTLSTED